MARDFIRGRVARARLSVPTVLDRRFDRYLLSGASGLLPRAAFISPRYRRMKADRCLFFFLFFCFFSLTFRNLRSVDFHARRSSWNNRNASTQARKWRESRDLCS